MSESFPDIRFRGQLRPSQKDVVKIVRDQMSAGDRKFHVVAPPGSGKTLTGLFLCCSIETTHSKAVLFVSDNT